jgi:predicted dehydrogenase
VNWRLDREISLGLAGEIAGHHFDDAAWFLGTRPVAVSGQGALRHWREDGRSVADTAQVVLEFPEGMSMVSSLTLASSFESEHEVFFGTDSAILLRDGRAWMFKEADAPLLGWEVHAKTETFRQDTGIVLVANASKQKPAADGSAEPAASPPPLYHALEAFVRSVQDLEAARADFVSAYGADDPKALAEHLAGVPRRSGAGYQESFEAAVVAIHAGEAVLAGRRIELKPEWFELGG